MATIDDDASGWRRPTTAPRARRSTAPFVEGTSISFEVEPPSADDMAARIAKTTARSPWLVAEVDGVVRGYAYGTRHRDRAAYDWTVETAVYVDAAYAGRGIGRLAMEALLDVLRRQGFHLAVAGITQPNPGVDAAPRRPGVHADRPVRGHRLEVRRVARGGVVRARARAAASDAVALRIRRAVADVSRRVWSAPAARSDRGLASRSVRPPPVGSEGLREPSPGRGKHPPPQAPRRHEPRADRPFPRPPREPVLGTQPRRQQADRGHEQPVVDRCRDRAQGGRDRSRQVAEHRRDRPGLRSGRERRVEDGCGEVARHGGRDGRARRARASRAT